MQERTTAANEHDAEEALAVAVAAIHRWADSAGVLPDKVLGPLAGFVAEQRVCAMFGLHPATSGVQAGWDAKDDDGRTYQVKARSMQPNTSFDFHGLERHPFDIALLVFYDVSDLSLVEVWEARYEDVLRHARVNRNRHSFRWPESKQYASLRYSRGEGDGRDAVVP